MPESTRILRLNEIRHVVSHLKRTAHRCEQPKLNLVIFRLACCCGLRRKEIAGLNLDDVKVDGPRPCLRVRAETTKAVGKKHIRRPRKVPLWWDAGTLADLIEWKDRRIKELANPWEPFVCHIGKVRRGQRLSPLRISRRWRTAIRCLGAERREQVSVHAGRHTAITHWTASRLPIATVRDAAGHASIATTNIYTHLLEDAGDEVRNVFR